MSVVSMYFNTPGIESTSKLVLIQKLTMERVHSVLTGIPFDPDYEGMIEREVYPPDYCRDPAEYFNFVKEEAYELKVAFSKWESQSFYECNIKRLVPYKGCEFQLTNPTLSGFNILIRGKNNGNK